MRTNQMVPDHREPKLPHWVQDTINDLRRRVEVAEARAEETRLATKPDESDTLVVRYGGGGDIGLGRGPTVRFNLDEGWSQYLSARVEDGRLIIHGGDQITVRPQSGNTIAIAVQR